MALNDVLNVYQLMCDAKVVNGPLIHCQLLVGSCHNSIIN
uniref:Uncharacterized protein n=1 Tax=Arundo donax TaxID=35708 RepID=A0A0A9HB96_ARUDO